MGHVKRTVQQQALSIRRQTIQGPWSIAYAHAVGGAYWRKPRHDKKPHHAQGLAYRKSHPTLHFGRSSHCVVLLTKTDTKIVESLHNEMDAICRNHGGRRPTLQELTGEELGRASIVYELLGYAGEKREIYFFISDVGVPSEFMRLAHDSMALYRACGDTKWISMKTDSPPDIYPTLADAYAAKLDEVWGMLHQAANVIRSAAESLSLASEEFEKPIPDNEDN